MKKNIKYFMFILTIILVICIYNIAIKYNTTVTEDYDKNKVTIWNIQGGLTAAVHEVIDGYKDIYPQVEFVIQDYENQVYKDIVKDILVTNEGPDIFFTWGFEFLREFVKGDMILDITEEVKEREYDQIIGEEKLSGVKFNNKIYGLPIQGFDTVLFLNENMFSEYGVKVPTTYDELLLAIDKFKSNGITPISIGGEEDWLLSMLYMTLVIREEGIETAKVMFESNEYLEGDGYIEAANKFVDLIHKGAFGSNSMNKTIKEAAYEFCNSKSAMFFGGSYDSNTIQTIDDEFSKTVKVIPFPIINDNSNLLEGVAGYTDSFVVNKYTENKDLVIDIYMRLVKDLSEKLVHERGGGLPVWCDENCDIDEEELIYKCLDVFPTKGYHEPYDILLPKEFADIHLNSLRELAKGNITVEEFINRQREYK
ncbi:extracellular solute-binding protein [Clostridioides difficile]